MADTDLRKHLLDGRVIPAHPLALTKSRALDERSQRALTRYYIASGAGGIAVGVHTTGFAIHDSATGLYRPVLELAAETADEALDEHAVADFVRVAGLVGDTAQAIREAVIARDLGYHCGLLSLGAWRGRGPEEILAHCRTVAEVIPLFGFYLQPLAGGMRLDYGFWQEFMEIPELVAIKVAPFDRYATLDVIRALALSGRDDVALYTGNDDSIVADLLTPFPAFDEGSSPRYWFSGGLLGQWAVWTRTAVGWLEEIHRWRDSTPASLPVKWLTRSAALTEANRVIFDAANQFRGCLPGILEVLRMQGLVQEVVTLNPEESLAPEQKEGISRIRRLYPWLTDDEFVAHHLDSWLR